MKKRFGKLRIVDSDKPPAADEIPIPPRPPKPTHIIPENPGHNYLNLDGATESSKPTTPSTPAQTNSNSEQNNPGWYFYLFLFSTGYLPFYMKIFISSRKFAKKSSKNFESSYF